LAASGRHLSDRFAPGFGDGPVYGVGGTRATYQWDSVALDDDGRLPIKVLWVAEPRYEGHALVRGLSVTGGAMRFDGTDPAEMRIEWGDAPSGEWREWPSMTRVSAPGCFAWQVDSEAGSDLIVFEVTGVLG
jgi:hypothetical protein